VISIPKRQLIAAGFSQTMAKLLEGLKNDAVFDAIGMLGLVCPRLNGRIVILAS
jgi:hypothetical protein